MTVPYTLSDGQTGDNVVVNCIGDDNKFQSVDAKYADGNAVFTTSHFSKYAVSYAVTVYTAGLKVLGNVNADNHLDADDAEGIQNLIDSGVTASLYPIADANNDGVIDGKDVDVINSVVKGEKTQIWNVNYHDADGNGTMDTELVSTYIPIKSAIMTGSANSFIMLYIMGITDEIVGASYGSTNDNFLYGDYYLDKDKVAKLGTSSTTIKFEDGKAGSSDVIEKKNVTCVLSDWNRTYLTNEADFEKAGVDCIRTAAASVDPEVYTHTYSLLGLAFDKVDRADQVIAAYDSALDTISKAVAGLSDSQVKKAVASSMDGYLSSEDSDYTKFCTAAGAVFGLEGYDFGGSASITVADNLDVFNTDKYKFDNIVHIRTALTYNSDDKSLADQWARYANAMNLWEHAYDGQVLISGAIPVPARVAYIAYAVYGDTLTELSKDWADGILKQFEKFYPANLDLSKAKNHTLALTSYEYEVTVNDGVKVTKADGEAVHSGDKFAYGTTLHIEPVAVKDGYLLQALGSNIDDKGNFDVIDNITARYVDIKVLNQLTYNANNFASNYNGAYGTASTEPDNEGKVTMTYTNYKGEDASKTFTFTYYDTEELAKAAYDDLATKILKKGTEKLDTSAYTADDFDGISVKFSNKLSEGKYAYSTLYLCAYKGNTVVNMVDSYTSCYKFANTDEGAKFMAQSEADRLAYFTGEATKFTDALALVLNPTKITIPDGITDAKAGADALVKAATKDGVDMSWTVLDGATSDSAEVQEKYTSYGKEKTLTPVKYVKEKDIKSAYIDAVNDLNSRAGVDKAYMSVTYGIYHGDAIDGVVYKAIYKATSTGSSIYVKFVMAAGDVLVDGYTGGDSGKGTYLDGGSWTLQAYLEAVASTLKAA